MTISEAPTFYNDAKKSVKSGHTSGKRSKIGKHTYKLSNSVKYISSGGEGSDQKYTKKAFIKYLAKCDNSGLGLVLTLNNGKVTKIDLCS